METDGGLRRIFRERLRQVDFVSVEIGTTGRGVPDVNYCVDGCEGWLEMKVTRGLRVRVSAEQVGWAERRMAHGGRVLVAVRDDATLTMLLGSQLRDLRDHRLRDVESLGRWGGGPARWDWRQVLRLLTMPVRGTKV